MSNSKTIRGILVDEPVDWAPLPRFSATLKTSVPARYRTRRGAMEWAIQFALEHPGSTGIIFGVTAVSLDMLFNGRNGLHHCLSDYFSNRLMPAEYYSRRFHVRLPNGSQFVGYPPTTRPERLDGLIINFVVAESAAPSRHDRLWDALQRRIRPLPGAENNIIYIVDDEADE